MKLKELPKTLKSPITGDELELKDKSFHNNESVCVAQFSDTSTEWVDDIVMYHNDTTRESIYVSYER